MRGKTITAFIFDMDGTIADTTYIDFLAWQKIFEELKVTFPYEDYIRLLGAKSSDIIRLYRDLPEEELEKALDKKLLIFSALSEDFGLCTVPFAKSFLQKAREADLLTGLATGSRPEKCHMILDRLHLRSFFDRIVTAEDIKNSKPDPEIFLKCAEAMGVEPANCLVFEDAENGVKAAKNAGMRCVAISTTTNTGRLKEADLIIDSYRSLDPHELCSILTGGKTSAF
jgi:beta-phosphoglucomutase